MREVSFFQIANLVGYNVEIVHKTKGVLRGNLFGARYDRLLIITKDSSPKAVKISNNIISIREIDTGENNE